MKIVITADPFIPVPPEGYGGIERIIYFLVEGLIKRGHEVTLYAHPASKTSAKLATLRRPNSATDHLLNILKVAGIWSLRPDVIHSFGRLAYLMPMLPSKIPKIMSYQREPTLSQCKKAFAISSGSLSFTGCSNYISNQIKPFAPAYTVFNGVDLKIYDFNEELPADAALVFLGRIEPIKGTHNAIEVARKSGKKLIIAGNIPDEHQSYFKEKIEPELDDQISYVGIVNDQQKNKLLGQALAFLMPIEWDEPFGIVMAEALACGTPVLGFPRGAVKEVVKHSVNGFISNNTEEMAKHVSMINGINRSSCRGDAEARFSSEIIVNSYIELYNELLKK